MAVTIKKKTAAQVDSASDFALSRVFKRKADTQVVVSMTPLEAEDEFNSFYANSKNNNLIIEPPFVPSQLAALCRHNNILQQCLHVMEVNIDGTGHQISLIEGKSENEAEKKKAESFFKEPFIGVSMVSLRRQLRPDLEGTGNGYLEVLRNAAGGFVMLRHLDAKLMRLVRYDDPVFVEKEIVRDDKVEKVKMWVRERRYVQKIGTRELVYFREFGSTRQLNRKTGEWATEALKAEDMASEVIHFIIDKDENTPYGVPRWINQLPSILGSRKSELFNLDFFDAGGLPPALVFIEGGTMGPNVKEQLLSYLGGSNKNKHRAAVVEVQPSSGSMESVGKVAVKVERFGDSRQADSMFQVFDENCEARTRGAFRLPTLFFGRSTDYNFATAITAYMVTEAQVFQPERMEFDEIVNKTLMKELGVFNYEFKSMPITLRNAEVQLQGLELVKDKIEGEDLVDTINDITGLTLQYSKEAEQAAFDREAKASPFGPGAVGPDGKPLPGAGQKPGMAPQKQVGDQKPGLGKPAKGLPVRKSASEVVQLTARWCEVMGIEKSESVYTAEDKKEVAEKVDALSEEDRLMFDSLLAARSFGHFGSNGVDELAAACCDALSHAQVH